MTIQEKFAELNAAGKKALVCYVTAGFPDFDKSIELLRGLEAAGADIVEVGVPFSDPMADGPVIQQSSQLALDNGMSLTKTFELISQAGLGIPVVLFSYLNPIIAAGEDVFIRAKQAGCAGILITDLPVGSDPELEQKIVDSELDFIRLVAPTTPVDRIGLISENGSGFVYLISRLGVTGMQNELAVDLPEVVERVRKTSSLPVCVGFGVSDPSQARKVASLADGVVVGTAVIKAAKDSINQAVDLVASIRSAIDSETSVEATVS